METKICPDCGKELPLSEFHKFTKGKDGHQYRCKKCTSIYKKTRYPIYREKALAYGKEYDTMHKAERCARDKARYVADDGKRKRAYYAANWERASAVSKAYRRKTKLAAFEAYGGAACALCGETILEFLCIDHIHGGGTKHRRENGLHDIYPWLKNNGYPPGFRVLCQNCNRREEARLRIKRETADWKLRRKVKREVFEAYGGKCVCCGETDQGILSIDHINNDGRAHRKAIGVSAGTKFYYWLRRNNYPPKFQLLCFNCNWGKHVNGGVCPHKQRGQDELSTS